MLRSSGGKQIRYLFKIWFDSKTQDFWMTYIDNWSREDNRFFFLYSSKDHTWNTAFCFEHFISLRFEIVQRVVM